MLGYNLHMELKQPITKGILQKRIFTSVWFAPVVVLLLGLLMTAYEIQVALRSPEGSVGFYVQFLYSMAGVALISLFFALSILIGKRSKKWWIGLLVFIILNVVFELVFRYRFIGDILDAAWHLPTLLFA